MKGIDGERYLTTALSSNDDYLLVSTASISIVSYI
jgi:hypothetical protein